MNDDDDWFEDSLEEAVFIPVNASRNQRSSFPKLSPKLHPSQTNQYGNNILRQSKQFLAGHDEAIMIQKVFRGHLGRKTAAKHQLLSERARLRSRDMERKVRVKMIDNSITSNSSYRRSIPHRPENILVETVPIGDNEPPVFIQRINKEPVNIKINKQVTSISQRDYHSNHRDSKETSLGDRSGPTIYNPKISQMENDSLWPDQYRQSDDILDNDSLEDSLETTPKLFEGFKLPSKAEMFAKQVSNDLDSDYLEDSLDRQSRNDSNLHRRDDRKNSISVTNITDDKVSSPSLKSVTKKPLPSIKDLKTLAKQSTTPQSNVSINSNDKRSSEPVKIHITQEPANPPISTAINPRQRIIQQQARRQWGATTIQRMFRGYRGRQWAIKRRNRIIDKFACVNCGRIEQSGEYCKGCGRPRISKSTNNDLKSKKKDNSSMINDNSSPRPSQSKPNHPSVQRNENPSNKPTKRESNVKELDNNSRKDTVPLSSKVSLPRESKQTHAIGQNRSSSQISSEIQSRGDMRDVRMDRNQSDINTVDNMKLTATVDLQIEENRIMSELAVIDRLQRKKIQSINMMIKESLPQRYDNQLYHLPEMRKERYQSQEQKKMIDNNNREGKLPIKSNVTSSPVKADSKANHKNKSEDKRVGVNRNMKDSEVPVQRKEKVAFTAAAKDYKPSNINKSQSTMSRLKDQIIDDVARIVEPRHIDSKEISSQSVVDNMKQPSPASIVTERPAPPKNPAIAYLNSGSGYLTEYHRRRSSSARRARIPTIYEETSISNDGANDIRSEGGNRNHKSNARHEYLETSSVPNVKQTDTRQIRRDNTDNSDNRKNESQVAKRNDDCTDRPTQKASGQLLKKR